MHDKRHLKIILTGALGVGKSWTIMQVLHNCRVPYRGFFTRPIFKESSVTGYFMTTELSHPRFTFADISFKDEPLFVKFGVKSNVFEVQGLELLDRLGNFNGFTIVDELGIMEQGAKKFVAALHELFAYAQHQIIVVQDRAEYLLSVLKSEHGFEFYVVNRANRDKIVQELSNKVLLTMMSDQQPNSIKNHVDSVVLKY